MENINITELFENAKKDPDLFSKIDVNELLKAVENENTDYLENKTLKSISQEIFDTLSKIPCEPEKIKQWCDNLIGYRLVSEIYELHKQKFVKTICIYDEKTGEPPSYYRMKANGKVANIRFITTGTQILCVSPPQRFTQYKFDHHLTFQELSEEEQMILMAYEYITEEEDKGKGNGNINGNTNGKI